MIYKLYLIKIIKQNHELLIRFNYFLVFFQYNQLIYHEKKNLNEDRITNVQYNFHLMIIIKY